MAVAFSAGTGTPNNHGGAAATGSVTTYTAAAGVAVMFAILTNGGAVTLPSCTWNGVSMTLLMQSGGMSVFYLLSPASGANTLTASWTTSRGWCLGIACFTGASAPLIAGVVTNSGTSTAPATGAISGGANDGYLGIAMSATGAVTVNPSTSIYRDNTNVGTGISYALGGTSASFTFTLGTSVPWNTAGIDIPAISVGGIGWVNRTSMTSPGVR